MIISHATELLTRVSWPWLSVGHLMSWLNLQRRLKPWIIGYAKVLYSTFLKNIHLLAVTPVRRIGAANDEMLVANVQVDQNQ